MIVKAYPEAAISELTDSQIKDIFVRLDTQFSEVMRARRILRFPLARLRSLASFRLHLHLRSFARV